MDPEQTVEHFAAVLGTPKTRRRIEHAAYGYVPAPTRERSRTRVAKAARG
ncbi:MAG: hypothetical protein L0323_23035 [Planctomycetes bacterium]|nr:hypothetical protein [Planctomycetota bacterium]